MRTNNHTTRNDRHLYEEVALEELPDAGLPLAETSLDAIALDEADGPVLHRDLGDIEVTASGADGLGAITINRTKGGTSPFVPIVKTPTFAENSGNLTGYAVEIEDPAAETGYPPPRQRLGRLPPPPQRRGPRPRPRGRRALGAPVQGEPDILGRRPLRPRRRLPRDGGGGPRRRRRASASSRARRTTARWRYECALMGKRFVCDNGALSGEFFARVAFRHVSAREYEAGAWKDVVREGLALVDRAPDDLHRFAAGLRALKPAAMTDRRLREVWRLFPTMGDSIKGQVVSRYVEHEEPSLFGLFNAGTNVLWHRERMTAADFGHNEAFTTGLLRYAAEHLN